ncbi:MAG: 16S rRNA (uracil(1498)-N(3))-methyltransferase [Firmicutes bacterium]|nr:16S rRNA (uracil(1498)-N(3))-methyltransferase [Bacillota bacterium]
MSRFFVGPENVGLKTIVIDNKDDLHHMTKVLRLKEGEEVDVSDSVEWEYRAKIVSIGSDEAQLEILDKQAFAGEPSVEVTLFQGIPKQGKMETIIQKCVELGVHEVVPVFMDRTVVKDTGNFGKKIDRWNKVSAETVKQCRRGIIPRVTGPVRLKEILAGKAPADVPSLFDDFDLVLFPYENEKDATIKDALLTAANPMYQEITGNALERIAVIIGPEGGFSDEEANAIVAAGGQSVSLGRTILRTETAGMAALAMILYELEL